ncbi:BtpA family protein [Teladorsagia circumcincta]|uniref:BtpA family protein n=1 Tax=Teladorsagia circumcincta TaxID=45464 RepID=A0A2G9UZI9_TELCI|nr:BtpA family protein [Teladorsagia circumcincta]
MDGCAGELLRYRRLIGADSIAVVTDVKKKHSSHAVTSDLSIADVAEAAQFFLADGVIVTGRCTGEAADTADFDAVRTHCSLPIFVGSGVTASNVHQFRSADALIVGSEFKKDGKWMNELDAERLALDDIFAQAFFRYVGFEDTPTNFVEHMLRGWLKHNRVARFDLGYILRGL